VPAVASRVAAASGLAQLQVGQDSSNDALQFAVATQAGKTGQRTVRLAVETDGRVRAKGLMTVQNQSPAPEVSILPGPADPEDRISYSLLFVGSATPAAVARPWSIYRATATDPNTKAVEERLCIEIRDPGKEGSRPNNSLVIAGVDAKRDGETKEVLTAAANGDVTISKVLIVEGGLFIVQAGKPDDSSGAPATPTGAPGTGPGPTVVGGRIRVDITKVDPTATDARCTFAVTVLGASAVSNLTLTVRFSAHNKDGTTVSNPPAVILFDAPLAPGATATRDAVFPIPGPSAGRDRLIVAVFALGTEPDGTRVGADVSRETPVGGPP
jgi:hypothetical protein